MTIGLLDHMGYGNLGDTAIQEAFISALKKAQPNATLIAFSLNPGDTKRRHNIDAHSITWCYPGWDQADAQPAQSGGAISRLKSFIKQLRFVYAWAKPIHDVVQELVHLVRSYRVVRSLDLLVMSGGGQLCELWGGAWMHPYNVFKFCMLAKMAGTPVFIVGVGAGPLDHPLSKFFARWSVRLASYTSFRDVESQTLVRSLGATRETHVYPDPAYALDLESYATCRPPANARLKVGLNPMGFCDPRIWPRKDDEAYQEYLDKVVAFILWLVSQNYCVEVFTTEISVDHYAIADLQKRLNNSALPDGTSTISYCPVMSLKELLTQMSQFDFIVTSKFHGVIFSHLLAKPVIALSYHHKIDDLMRAVGHDEYCLDVEHFELDPLKTAFRALVHNRERLSARFCRTTASYGAAVQRQFDELFAPRNPKNILRGVDGREDDCGSKLACVKAESGSGS